MIFHESDFDKRIRLGSFRQTTKCHFNQSTKRRVRKTLRQIEKERREETQRERERERERGGGRDSMQKTEIHE